MKTNPIAVRWLIVVAVGLLVFTGGTHGDCSEQNSTSKNYRLDAQGGDAEAQAFLGYLYLTGSGSVLQDYKMALSWFTKAAVQGNWFAAFNLGEMYYYGVGVNQNYAEALKWYLKSAARGIVRAEYYVANMYRTGEGGVLNYTLALKWYQRSAEKGFRDAQYQLANMYYEGMGSPVDHKKAYIWFSIASTESQEKDGGTVNEQAKAKINELNTLMTAAHISEAKKEAAVLLEKLHERNDQMQGR